MSFTDDKLLERIAKGTSIVLIGSGPSCAMGYPSWCDLAKKVSEQIIQSGISIEKEAFDQYINQKIIHVLLVVCRTVFRENTCLAL